MAEEKLSNSFAVFTATGRILAMLAGFAMPIFLTHFLPQKEYGLYSQFYTLLLFIGTIFSVGMQSNLYYFYPRANDEQKKTYTGNTFLLLLVCSFLALICLSIPFIHNFFFQDSNLSSYTIIICICILFYIPTNILFPLFVIRKDKKLSVIFPPMEIILKLLLVIGAASIFGTLSAILVSILVLQGLLFTFTLLYMGKPIKHIQAPWFNLHILREQIKYALPFGMAVVLFTLLTRFDKLLCISYLTPTEYAIYSIAFFGIPGIQQIYDSVSEVNLLNMTKTYKNGDLSATHTLYKEFTYKLLSFSIPLIFIVCVFSESLFTLFFPESYLAAVPFFQVYIFSFIFGALGAGTILRATGHTKKTLYAYLYVTVIYLPFAFFTIKHYGLWGALSTAMFGLVLPKLMQIYFEKHILGVKLSQYMPWKIFALIVLISIIPLIPILIYLHFVEKPNIILVITISIIYLLIVYITEMQRNLFIINSKILVDTIHKFKANLL